MAGRKADDETRGDRRKGAGKGTRRGRAHVPPIIDLEATIVEDKKPADETAQDRAKESSRESGARPDGPTASWMDEMKTFFLGGVHVGRWRIPAAGTLLVLLIFIAGLVGGRLMTAGPEAPAGDTATTRHLDALAAELKQLVDANQGLVRRLDGVGERLDTVSTAVGDARSAADAALGEVRTLQDGIAELAPAAPAQVDESLKRQIAELATRIESLGETVPQGATDPNRGKLVERMAGLERSLGELKDAVDKMSRSRPEAPGGTPAAETALAELKAQLAEGLAAVVARLEALEADRGAPEPADNRSNPAWTALSALQKAIDSGAPYQRQLADLAAAMPGDPAITEIAPRAPQGVPTRAALAERFEAVARELTGAPETDAQASEEDSGLITDMLNRMNTLVDLRKSTDPGSQLLFDAVVAAREQLERGDLDRAAAALSAGGEGLTESAQQWITDARARGKVDGELNALLRRALAASARSES